MGMLKSDTPKIPNPVYVEPIETEDNTEELKRDIARKRGIVGTINTSWQGLLNKDENAPKRKTLLGE